MTSPDDDITVYEEDGLRVVFRFGASAGQFSVRYVLQYLDDSGEWITADDDDDDPPAPTNRL